MFRYFFVCFYLCFFMSCKTQQLDIFENPAKNNYLAIEFEYEKQPFIGVLNINISEEVVPKNKISIKSIGSTVLIMKSSACDIDKTFRFNNEFTFMLNELIPTPKKCIVNLYAYNDWGNFNLIEKGKININNAKYPANIIVKRLSKDDNIYSHIDVGQSSLQQIEGGLSDDNTLTILTPSKSGFILIKGCQYKMVEKRYETSYVDIPLSEIYQKNVLLPADSCDFELNIVPDDGVFYSFLGNISINIYDGLNIKLEQPRISIQNDRLVIQGANYVAGICVNNICKNANEMKVPYNKDTLYNIKTFTTKGRKSVKIMKNLQPLWGD